MFKLCDEIQNAPKYLYQKYSNVLLDTVQWYKDVHEKFSEELKKRMYASSMEDYSVVYKVLAQEKLLLSIEPIFRLTLARFSYGPSKRFLAECGFDDSSNLVASTASWIDSNVGFYDLAEILARVLKKNQVLCAFDLAVLASDRVERNKIHKGTRIDCANLIRKYRSLRELLVFLDSDNNSLPPFEEGYTSFDYDKFISEPSEFSFRENVTVLISDSVHDVPTGYRDIVANLPWDMVIDFDGYSDFGGLLSSVSHNSLRKEWLLAKKSFSLAHPDRMQTAWCRCGEYLSPIYLSKNMTDTSGAHRFMEYAQTDSFYLSISDALQNALKVMISLQQFVNIVVLSDNNQIVKGLIDALRHLRWKDYYISWVGMSKSSVKYDLDETEGEDFREEHFYHHECPIFSFFQQFYNYRANWEPRCSVQIEYALSAGSRGFVSLNENTRNNLSPYFEVLYREWDSVEHPDEALADPFRNGGQATWKDIAAGEALPLDDGKAKDLISRIKTNTGRAQEDCPQKNLFFVVHKPGIGGTTFTKQIAWKLHNDMTVLKVKRYDETKTFQLLQNLYDNVVEKNPILLLVEDTLPNLEAMCDAFLVLMRSRRCALLVACRASSGIYEKYKDADKTRLLQLNTDTIRTFQNRFREISALSAAELTEKVRNFDKNVNSDIRLPLL